MAKFKPSWARLVRTCSAVDVVDGGGLQASAHSRLRAFASHLWAVRLGGAGWAVAARPLDTTADCQSIVLGN
jgi:hypothetical protein